MKATSVASPARDGGDEICCGGCDFFLESVRSFGKWREQGDNSV